MKKLLGLLLVMTMTWPVASAEVLKNVEVKGEVQTIASDVHHNTVPATYSEGTSYRVLAGLSAQLVEDVQANILFQHVDGWHGDISGESVDTYTREVEVANANLVLSNLFDRFELTLGRQFYGDEDSAVMYIGPDHYIAETEDWNTMKALSIDAVKLTYADDVKALTVIAGKFGVYNDPLMGRINLLGGDDDEGSEMYGADFRWNMTETFKLQAYAYDFRKVSYFNPDGNLDKNAGFYGAKLTFQPEEFLLSAEYARNFGGNTLFKEHEKTGYMVKADAAMNLNDELTTRGTFLYANENFSAFGNYNPGLLIGHEDEVYDYSLNGVRMFNLGVDYRAFEKWTFSLDGFSFQDREGKHAATWEADLTAKYQHNEYVQLFAGVGYAKYGNDVDPDSLGQTYKELYNKDNFKYQLGMLVTF